MTRDPRDDESPDVSVHAEGGESLAKRSSFDVTMDEGLAAAQNASAGPRFSTGTLIMVGVILLAGASLWSMRAIDRAVASGPRTSKADEELVSKMLERGSGASFAIDTDATRLLEPTEAVSETQVPLKEIAKNPFVLWAPPSTPGTSPAPDKPQVDTRAERVAEWERKVDQAAASVRVLSTMSTGRDGNSGIANVNGHMMRMGDVFGVQNSGIEFSIDRIERDAVTMRTYSNELKHERIVTIKVNRKW